MTAILGIDAAWTPSQPSGVALISRDSDRWVVRSVAPSYDAFEQIASGGLVNWRHKSFRGGSPQIERLLKAAQHLGARTIDLIALDIPLARTAVVSRRASDSAISKAFGSKGCSTHSPTKERPGLISDEIKRQLDEAGFALHADRSSMRMWPGAIEVYPHPALLALLSADYRLPYKVSKSRQYWKGTTVAQRIRLLLEQFHLIYRALERELGDLGFQLPSFESVRQLSQLKRYEDALDALVCAWVGAKHFEGETTAYGDDESVIWVP